MRRIALTVDVEAHPFRAARDHIDRLIWGRLNGREAGIGTMMDIADRYGVPMTFFVDYPEYEQYGEAILDVAREIAHRGHDAEPHCHAEYLAKPLFGTHDPDAIRLGNATPEQAARMAAYLIERHVQALGSQPLVQRSRGYELSAPWLDALKAAGFVLDASYSLSCKRDPLHLGLRGPFRFSNGLLEIPVPFVPYFQRAGRLIPWNFNARCFLTPDPEENLRRHEAFLDAWFQRHGEDAIAPLVLHSWSFWKMDGEGFFTIPDDTCIELFDSLLSRLATRYAVVSLGQVAAEEKNISCKDNERVDASRPVERCPICFEPASHFEDFNGIRRRCPFCGSVERHRTLVDLLYAGAFGPDVFRQRDILHIAPGRPEKLLLRRMYQPRITTLNILPGCDLQADIQNMPELADNSFDVVLASEVFRHVRDLNKALAEIARVLRPGGLLLCSDCLENADYGREITDLDEQTVWYGREKWERYGIGDFRRFGRKDWESAFAPYFLTRIFKADDTATGSPAWWMACTPRPDAADPLKRQKCLSLHAAILRSFVGRIVLDAMHDPIQKFLPNFDNWQDYRRKSSSCNLTWLKENIFTLCFRQYQILPSARSSAIFPSRIPEDIHPYKEQSFQHLLPELSQDGETGDSPCLQHMVAETERWIDTYGFFSQSSRMDNHTRWMVWDDAAAAIRLNVMEYIFLRILPLPDYPAVLIEKIFRSMQDHFSLLCTDHFFTVHNNHGWLQMFGLLSFCRAMPQVYGASIAVSIATERTMMLCEKLLTRDGMLREHSPAYQAFVITLLNSMRKLLPAQTPALAKLDELLAKMRFCLSCVVTPDGGFAAFGDSSFRPYDLIKKETDTVTRGEGLLQMPHSGYAALRVSSLVSEDTSFLVLSGAYHSYTHKHCDDLSFVWSEGCQNILIDSGKQVSDRNLLRSGSLWQKGFFYASPNCVYAESAHAHNIVEINGETWSRYIAAYGVLPLRGQRLSEKHWLLEGEWQRPEGFRQQRRLILSPGRWLLVLDTLTPLPDTPQKITRFSQWFHLAPTVELEERQKLGAVFRLPDNRRLHCRSLLPETSLTSHKGECFPRLQGWVADTDTTLIPAWAFGWHSTSMTGSFCTIFSLIGPCLKGVVTENSCTMSFTHGHSEQLSWINTASTQNI